MSKFIPGNYGDSALDKLSAPIGFFVQSGYNLDINPFIHNDEKSKAYFNAVIDSLLS